MKLYLLHSCSYHSLSNLLLFKSFKLITTILFNRALGCARLVPPRPCLSICPSCPCLSMLLQAVPLLFHIVLAACGLSLKDAQNAGWVMQPPVRACYI